LIDSAILSIPEIVFDWLVENEWDKSNDAWFKTIQDST
jgi:hypothetical protein